MQRPSLCDRQGQLPHCAARHDPSLPRTFSANIRLRFSLFPATRWRRCSPACLNLFAAVTTVLAWRQLDIGVVAAEDFCRRSALRAKERDDSIPAARPDALDLALPGLARPARELRADRPERAERMDRGEDGSAFVSMDRSLNAWARKIREVTCMHAYRATSAGTCLRSDAIGRGATRPDRAR